MKVFRLATGRPVPPFNDAPGDVQVLGRSLDVYQREQIEEAGCELVEECPRDEPYLLISDRTWFTRATLELLKESPGRLQVKEPEWRRATGPLQQLIEEDVYELAHMSTGLPPIFTAVPNRVVEIGIVWPEMPTPIHQSMAHAVEVPEPVCEAGVLQIDHWCHILKANLLAMGATIQREKRRWEESFILLKLWKVLVILLKARSLQPTYLLQALTSRGERCQIHPTAVVEGAVLGDDVYIGPYAVVRGSVLKDGVRIEEHAIVNGSILGERARIGRKGMCNLCVLYPDAFVSTGWGHQFCLFGEGSFLAHSGMIYDLSFAKPIKVWMYGERVSTGWFFLGGAVGHRARLGGRTVLGYGAEVPNDALLVGPAHEALRKWEEGPGPHRVVDGIAKPLGIAPEAPGEEEE